MVVALLGSGCTESRFEFLRHSVEVDRDPLCDVACKPDKGRFAVDLRVENFAYDDRLFLEAMIQGLRDHPGLEVRTLTAEGAEAFRAPRILRAKGAPPPKPAPRVVELGVSHEFSGHWWNTFLAFPGMIPLLPAWRGYDYDLDMAFSGRVAPRGSDAWSDFSRELRWEFREMNHPRSAAFHIWPSTGIYGTQFVLGLVMSPLMCFYDPQYGTEILVKALQPRFGRWFASEVYRRLAARAEADAGPIRVDRGVPGSATEPTPR